MRKSQLINAMLASTLVIGSGVVHALSVESTTEFFNKIQTMSNNFDSTVFDLYAEDGKLLATRISADGTSQPMSIPIATLRATFPNVMKAAKASGDVSEYSNVSVEVLDESTAKVTATHYSALKCFADDSYYMIVRENTSGELEVVEEYSVSLEQGRCEVDNALMGTLMATADAYNVQLPAMVDEDTQLSSVTADGTSLSYNYKFVALAAEDVVENLADVLREGVIQSSCDMNPSKMLLERGAELVFNYISSDDVLVGNVIVTQADCAS